MKRKSNKKRHYEKNYGLVSFRAKSRNLFSQLGTYLPNRFLGVARNDNNVATLFLIVQKKQKNKEQRTKSLIKLFISLSILYLLGTSLSAQQIQIFEAETQKPISEVTIIDAKNNFLGMTNEAGQANLQDWDTTLSLLFQHVSYKNILLNHKELKKNEFTVYLQAEDFVLPEMTVKANRIQENYREVSNQLVSISTSQIQEQQAATSADLLQGSAGVYVQKSQMGGGSPIIRGMEANKVLITLDGVRLNNAIYRGGHLQSVITIDPAILENVEVVFGPGSLVYGSDALGGVMSFTSKKPQVSQSNGLSFTGNISSRFATATQGKTAHLDFNLGGKKWASLSSISYNDFEDLDIGQQRKDQEGDWGLRPFYVERINEQDSIITNETPNILKFTGYNQTDLLQKFLFQLGANKELVFNFQYSTSSNIPRFDKLNDLNDNENPASLKFAEWSYGPQKRLMAAVHFSDKTKKKYADEWQSTIAFQDIEESRLIRRVGADWRDNQIEKVEVWTFNLDALKIFTPEHKLQYGFEWTQNEVESTAFAANIIDAQQDNQAIETRYPDGDNATSSYALYARHKWLLSNEFTLSTGLRWGLNSLRAAFKESAPLDIDFTQTEDQHQALTFALGATYYPKTNTRLAANISSGFRSPNIDDVGKLFDPSPNAVVVPNAAIGPEYSYSAELDWQQQIKSFTLQINAYGSLLTDLIRRNPDQINGQDSIVYNGDLSQIFSNTNTGKAQIAGIALKVNWKISSNFTFQNKVLLTKGKDITANAPLGHIPPIYGQSSIDWFFLQNKKRNKLSFWTDYNLKKDIADYSPNNEDKIDEALPTGTPAWFTINARYHFTFLRNGTGTFAVENILDKHYKPFASGLSGAGRNFLFGVSWGF